MKRLFWSSFGWSLVLLAVPAACALYVISVPNPAYDPALDNDGDLQGAGILLLSMPILLVFLTSLFFAVGLIGHSIRTRRTERGSQADAASPRRLN